MKNALADVVPVPTNGIETKRVVVVLIKPTHYDDAGFPHRYWRAVLPSNSLAVMRSLTETALAETLHPDTPLEIHVLEDGIASHAWKLWRLERRFPEPGTKLVVGFVAVQTAQFDRACDLIERWQTRGATCVIGGFHVSGSISALLDGIRDATRKDVPCPKVMPPEIQALMNRGGVVFHGEAEEIWREALADILAGCPKPLYRGGQPDLRSAPLPSYPRSYFHRAFVTTTSTFDTGRGCPFACSFCTIINVQGRKSRFRDPQAILEQVEATCIENEGKASFFFTDDNFATNPFWKTLLDGLITLRAKGCAISFMIEADLAHSKQPTFLEKLAQAGCTQIFMGVESMNPENLRGARKHQNKVGQFAELWRLCHEQGIAVHAGYIVGFPNDTPASVMEDVHMLHELGVDQASFFVLTPLPGSEDHVRVFAAGVPMDTDFSRFDSFHTVIDHPLMTKAEWFATYQRAWRQFYTVENMIAALKRFTSRQARLSLLRNYVWYRWSFATERTHPMIAGFYRFRDFWDRRPSAPRLSFARYLLQEVGRHFRYLGLFLAEFYRFQHVYYEAECGPSFSERRGELYHWLNGIGGWLRYTCSRRPSRTWLNAFWIQYGRHRWQLLWNPLVYRWHLLAVPHALAEVVYTIRFAVLIPWVVKMTTKG